MAVEIGGLGTIIVLLILVVLTWFIVNYRRLLSISLAPTDAGRTVYIKQEVIDPSTTQTGSALKSKTATHRLTVNKSISTGGQEPGANASDSQSTRSSSAGAKKAKSPARKEREYDVEEILNKQERSGHTYYLIKWRGYSADQNTWEPEENLEKVRSLLEAFERKSSVPPSKRSSVSRKSIVTASPLPKSPKQPQSSVSRSPTSSGAVRSKSPLPKESKRESRTPLRYRPGSDL